MKPVLMLVPGMLNDERVWVDVVDALGGEADVRVASVVGQPTIAAMAADAWKRLEDVPLSTPLVLAGFSMGGYVVMEMLAQRAKAPRPLHGLALLSTSGRPETAEGTATRLKTLEGMQADFPKMVDGILKWGTFKITPPVETRLRQMMLDLGLEAATAHTHAIMGRRDPQATLAALQVPTRILCGAKDRVTPPVLAQELSGWIPGARLEIIEECGHMLPAERPDAVTQALRSLLA